MRLPCLLPAVLAALTTIAPTQSPIVATTGEPELVETGSSGYSFALSEAEYQKEAQRLATDARFIPMTKQPAGLSDKARFGVGFVLEERNRCWAIDGDAASGYTFYGDVNGNGDLSDDAPRRFVDEQGKPTLRMAMESPAAGGETHPILMKLQLERMTPSDRPEPALALVRYSTLRRRGQVRVDASAPPLTFRATGPQGLFNLSYGSMAFDFDGDGAFDPEIERYGNKEKFVNIAGATYEFAADKYGNRVTFTRQAVTRPNRVILKTGYPAPDFALTDLDGTTRRLSDFRGKVVLLDFWGTWCGPCVAAVPELVRLYATYHARGFEILGVEARDTREIVAAFTAAHRMPWPQTLEKETGPISTLYRVDGWPTAFLVGADGRFLAANYLGEVNLAEELAKAFPAAVTDVAARLRLFEIPLADDRQMVRDVSGGDEGECAHAERIAAGRAGSLPRGLRHVTEERDGRRAHGLELTFWSKLGSAASNPRANHPDTGSTCPARSGEPLAILELSGTRAGPHPVASPGHRRCSDRVRARPCRCR